MILKPFLLQQTLRMFYFVADENDYPALVNKTGMQGKKLVELDCFSKERPCLLKLQDDSPENSLIFIKNPG